MSDFRAIILAAGKGTRMKSATPKVLHNVGGRPILDYVLEIARGLRSLKTYVVVGHGAAKIKQAVGNSVEYVLQDQLLGTGDAVRRLRGRLANFNGTVLVLCGDTPLLSKDAVRALLSKHRRSGAAATILTAMVDNPHGYGRIVRDRAGRLLAIREQEEAFFDEDKIQEINVGAYCFQTKSLFATLAQVKANPKKREYYLTDVIEILLNQGRSVATLATTEESVAFGVNTREDLAQAEAVIRQRILKKLMAGGVTIVDPATTYVQGNVFIGRDTVIYPCTVIDQNVRIGQRCRIGPLAHIRPGSRIGDDTEIGNFAEVSRTTVGKQALMKHFSFLGDATVGHRANIGAGSVTANFDGRNKHKTTIGQEALIGSDTILVAPVVIGKRAVVGAGSVVTKGKRIPAGAVAVGVPARIIRK